MCQTQDGINWKKMWHKKHSTKVSNIRWGKTDRKCGIKILDKSLRWGEFKDKSTRKTVHYRWLTEHKATRSISIGQNSKNLHSGEDLSTESRRGPWLSGWERTTSDPSDRWALSAWRYKWRPSCEEQRLQSNVGTWKSLIKVNNRIEKSEYCLNVAIEKK